MASSVSTYENINERLNIEAIASEYKRIKMFIGALVVGLLVMGYLFFGMENVDSFFINPNTPKAVIGWIFLFIAYEGIALFIVRGYLKNNKCIPEALKIGNVIIESTFPGFLIFSLSAIEWTPMFLDSPLIMIYFILIALSALHLDFKLSILTGLVSALGYFLVTIWSITTFDPNYEVLNFPLLLYVVRSIFILIAGLCAAFVAKEIQNRIINSFALMQEKNKIEGLFGQQVSPKVVEALVKDRTSKKIEVSIMFLDIRNFSSFAEQRDPKEVIAFQNHIFGPLINIINDHNGIINQILGDGFLATFGAPVKDEDHAPNAVNAGLEIFNKIKELGDQGIIPSTKVGIGAHSGVVITGNIGNEIRQQYSVSGSPVIIAARLEQLTKEYGADFLVSKELYQKTKGHNFRFTELGQFKVKNLDESLEVYKVEGISSPKHKILEKVAIH